MSRAWPVNENGRPVMQAASHVIVVVPCAKCACRWRTSGAEQPVGERDRLEQLLDVDLARAGEAASGGRGRPGRTRSGARARRRAGGGGAAPQRGQELAQVAVAPRVQRLRQALRVGQVLRLGLDRVEHRMPVALLARLDRLDDVQAQRHAGLLDPVDLGRDERLGDPREPHQDVGDGPVHTPVTTVTRPYVTRLKNLLLHLDQRVDARDQSSPTGARWRWRDDVRALGRLPRE